MSAATSHRFLGSRVCPWQATPAPIIGLLLAALFAFGGCTNPGAISAGPAPAAAVAPAPHVLATSDPGVPRNAYVLLSGGGTPLSNHYSQYVQAQAIARWLERTCPPESTWVFFGAGNRPGQPAALADVRRDSTRDGLVVSSWLPGVLPNSRPATRESFLRALREEILPVVRSGGTLFLFVGDHGELAGPEQEPESAITLWQLKRGTRRRAARWVTDETEILGVAELRKLFAEGLGAGRVLFCMTQCHGGGFHELGVTPEIQPPGHWFAVPAAKTAGNSAALRLRVAGYTATDEASPAAGCDPDPIPERWAGYERFLPESLLGIDLLSGQAKGRAAATLAQAHQAATLVDHTIDKPRATSDHYLATWADMIETKLARTLLVTPVVATAVAGYQRAIDVGTIGRQSEGLRARQAQFHEFTAALSREMPDSAPLLASGTRQQLEAAIAERPGAGRGGPRRGAVAELRRAWSETLRPAWKAAVFAGALPDLRGPTLQFEKHLLGLEDDGVNFGLIRGGESMRLLHEVYWQSGYANPATVDPAAAEAVARWAAGRRARIVAWGRTSGDPAVRAAAAKLGPGTAVAETAERPLTRQTAAERVLFYRRVLAAWEFLLTMNATTALAELHALIDLEHTLLPAAP